MNCDELQSLVDPYVDGEIDSSRARDVEEHLRTCPNCTGLHESLLTLKRSIALAQFIRCGKLRGCDRATPWVCANRSWQSAVRLRAQIQ